MSLIVVSGTIEKNATYHTRRWTYVGGCFEARCGVLCLTECERRKTKPDRLWDTAWAVHAEGPVAGLYRLEEKKGGQVVQRHRVNLAAGWCDCKWHQWHGNDPEAVRCRHLLALAAVAEAGGFDGDDDDDDTDDFPVTVPPGDAEAYDRAFPEPSRADDYPACFAGVSGTGAGVPF